MARRSNVQATWKYCQAVGVEYFPVESLTQQQLYFIQWVKFYETIYGVEEKRLAREMIDDDVKLDRWCAEEREKHNQRIAERMIEEDRAMQHKKTQSNKAKTFIGA